MPMGTPPKTLFPAGVLFAIAAAVKSGVKDAKIVEQEKEK